jgi:putative membrane protein
VRIYFIFFLVLILLAIAFVFGSQNEQIISLNYLAAKVELSIAAAVSLFTSIGFVLGLLTTLLWRLVRNRKKSLSKKRSTEA